MNAESSYSLLHLHEQGDEGGTKHRDGSDQGFAEAVCMGPFEAAGEDPASVVTDVEEEKTSMKGVQKMSPLSVASEECKKMRICIF